MSDEKYDAVSQREVRFVLAALSVPASKAERLASGMRLMWPVQIFVAFLPATVNVGLAAYSLWLIFTGHTNQWQDFWTRTLATLAWTLFALILLSMAIRRRLFPTSLVLQIHQGVQALRQVAASGDGKLTPVHTCVAIITMDSGSESMNPTALGPLHRLDRQRGRLLLILSLVLVVCGATLTVSALVPQATSLDRAEYLGTAAAILLLVAFAVIVAVSRLRSLTIIGDKNGLRWRRPVFGFRHRKAQAPWPDARSFLTFRARKDAKSADMDEIFLLDTTTEALAWRITPKTPVNVREAHERFVRMANEHVQLRDITASLKNLLESPETRSYEYAVAALSGPVPVPPAVRKVLTIPVRESHFLRGYLIVAAILLALLVAVGLLLQSGLIPAGSF
jgi:hypothetical protein